MFRRMTPRRSLRRLRNGDRYGGGGGGAGGTGCSTGGGAYEMVLFTSPTTRQMPGKAAAAAV